MPDDPTKSKIYIDVEDDITTIIEKAEEAPRSIVALILPKRSGVLQSIVNMRLLKQSTEAAGKRVVLITSEAALLPLAGAVGLPVSRNLQTAPEIPSPPDVSPKDEAYTPAPAEEKPRGGDKPKQRTESEVNKAASVGALSDAHERKEPETVELDDEDQDETTATGKGKLGSAMAGAAAKIPKVKVPNFDRFRKRFVVAGAGLIGLVLFLYLALSVWPRATINITTTATPVSLNMNMSASGGAKKLDTANNIIPSSVQTFKQTTDKKITPTGKQDIGSKATGTLSIKNCDTSSPSSVPAGSKFTSSNGKVFLNATSFTPTPAGVSGGSLVCGSSVSVSVVAESAGDIYNIGPSTYTSDTLNSNYQISGSAMSGGSSQVVTVVSQQDLDKALQEVTGASGLPSEEETTNQFKSDLDKQGYYLITSTLKVSKPAASSSPAVGQQASSATVTVTTTYSVLALKKDDLTKAITNYAQQQIDKSKQQIDSADILKNVTVEIASQSSPTDAALTISGNVNAMPLLDADAIKKDVVGKKKGAINSDLSGRPGVKSVDIRLSPFWVSKVPGNESKVKINIHSENGSN